MDGRLILAGRRVETADLQDSLNPTSLEPLGRFCLTSPQECVQAVQAASGSETSRSIGCGRAVAESGHDGVFIWVMIIVSGEPDVKTSFRSMDKCAISRPMTMNEQGQ